VKGEYDEVNVNIKRIDPTCADEEKIDNVLVIFFATLPSIGGQAIIGWYKNATVYHSFQSPLSKTIRNGFKYNIEAKSKNAVLLPIGNRKQTIGHGIKGMKAGNPGQANAFYVYDENYALKSKSKCNNWIYEAIDYVNKYNGPTISSFEDEVLDEMQTSLFGGSGQGFQSDVEKRLAIEKHAMKMCKEYYFKKGYTLTDVSKNKPYDFQAQKGKTELFIETKGTQTDASKIILTKNEVELSQQIGHKMSLFIVHSIEFNKKSIKKGSGKIKVVYPWEIDKKNLTPISYIYTF
jgi:hypothetical protein